MPGCVGEIFTGFICYLNRDLLDRGVGRRRCIVKRRITALMGFIVTVSLRYINVGVC